MWTHPRRGGRGFAQAVAIAPRRGEATFVRRRRSRLGADRVVPVPTNGSGAC